MASPAVPLALLWLLALDAGAELEERLELEEVRLLEELELATSELDELELCAAVLLTWPPELLLDDPPPQLGSAQAHRKQALMRLYRFDLNIVIVEDVSKGVVMFASKRELITLYLLRIVHK
jgi:ABC-type branched-subunit amino acid transport system ATPase component